MVAARKQFRETLDERLDSLHYKNSAPITDLLDAFSFNQEKFFFNTVDLSMWRVWQLGLHSYDTLSDDEKTSVSDSFADVINAYPDNSSGQVIKYTHNDIRQKLYDFAKNQSENEFGKDLMKAIWQRQIEGANTGFLKTLTKRQLDQALNELVNEVDDDDFRYQLTHSLERTMTTGQYANQTELYLCFRYSPAYSTERRSMLSTLFQSVLTGMGLTDIESIIKRQVDDELRTFLIHSKKIEDRLTNSGFVPSRLTGQGLINMYFRELNPQRSLDGRAPEYNPSLTIRQQVYDESKLKKERRKIAEHSLFSKIVPRHNGFKIDNTFFIPVSLTSLPRKFYPGMLHDVLTEKQNEGWAVINFHVPNQTGIRVAAKTRAMLIKSERKLYDMLPWDIGNSDLSEEKSEHLKTLQNMTDPETADRLKAVYMSCHIVLKGPDEKELVSKARDLETALWNKGYYEDDRGDAIVHHCIPLNFRPRAQKLIARYNTNVTPFMADLCPLYGSYQGLVDGDILLNNADGQPIFISQIGDHVQAGHSIIIGGTGSGKSYFVSNLLQQYKARKKTKIIMIDKGASYESTCESYDGQYIHLTLSSHLGQKPPCINPFHIPPSDEQLPVTPSDEEITFMHSILLAMIRTGSEQGIHIRITKPQSNLLMQNLRECLDKRVGIEQVTVTTIIEHLRHLHGEMGSELASMLLDYQAGVGMYGQMFDGELDVNWDNDFIVIETDKISNTPCMPVAMMVLFYQISMYFKYKLPEQVTKILGIDEAWSALANPTVAQAVTGYILELRKYNAFVMLISQTIAHFVNLVNASRKEGESASSGLLENIFHFFFLACSHNDHKMAKELLDLTDEEDATWNSVSSLPPFFSEIFYRYKNKEDRYIPGKIRLYSNPISYWSSTTHPIDKAYRRKFTEKYLKRYERADAKRRAIAHLARKYPYGARYNVEEAT